MIDVYKIIKDINNKRKESGTEPYYAVFGDVITEVTRQVKQEINALITAKRVRHHKTINSFSFEALDEEDKPTN